MQSAQDEGRGRQASSPIQPLASLTLEARLGLVRRRRRGIAVRRLAIGPMVVVMSILLLGAVSGVAALR